jgi:hypothetical protein
MGIVVQLKRHGTEGRSDPAVGDDFKQKFPFARNAKLARSISSKGKNNQWPSFKEGKNLALYGAAVGWFGVIALSSMATWTPSTVLMHLFAAPNCDAARLVGLAPAKTGQPGYWLHLDRDGDGISCEVWHGHKRRW